MIMLHFKSLHVFFHILIPLIIRTVRLCGEHFLTHYILKSYIKIIKKKITDLVKDLTIYFKILA